MLKSILPCLKGYKKHVVLTLCLVAAEVFFEISIPFVMSRIVDIGILEKNTSYILRMGAAMTVMALMGLLSGALSARFAAVAGAGFGKTLRARLFGAVQDLSFSSLDTLHTGSLVTRLTSDITNVQTAFMLSIRILVRAPLMLLCAVILSIAINAKLAFIFLTAIPILGLIFYFIITQAHTLYIKMLNQYDRINNVVQENLIGIRLVKAFVREDYETKQFDGIAEKLRIAQLKADRMLSFNIPAMQLVMYACLISIFWFGGHMIVNKTMLTGELLGFLSYVTQIMMSLMIISMVSIAITLSKASLLRIEEVFLEHSQKKMEEGTVTEMDCASIRFENVSFGYTADPEKYILKNISFSVQPGQTVGIIGKTGSSKSTLVQLIPRLYNTSAGHVYLGGRNVKEYTLYALRQSIGMVPQKSVLFSGTIRDNLKWGNPEASDKELAAACQAACIHTFITRLPHEYDTDLGEGGVNLSGGQKQRLCIARALLKKPKILILDDSTSATDTNTEARIHSELKKYLKNVTTFVIAQRLSTVRHADVIIVLDQGCIDGIGTHSYLLHTNKIYRNFFESQYLGDANDAAV